MSYEKAPSSGAFLLLSLMHFLSGAPMHHLSGVDTLAEIGIRRQVGRIAAMAKKLGAGDLSIRIAAPFPGGELGRLMRELNSAANSLQRQHTAIGTLNRELQESKQVEARSKVFLDTVIEHIPLPVSVKVPRDATKEKRLFRKSCGCFWQLQSAGSMHVSTLSRRYSGSRRP